MGKETSTPPKSLKKRLALALFGLVFGCLLAEWGFRGLVAVGAVEADVWPLVDAGVRAAIHRYSDDPELVYECRPGSSTTKDGVTVEINQAGFRGPEFALERRPGVPRVAVLGDSVAFAVEVSEPETFPALLRRERREVLNFAVTGYNSDQERIQLDTRVLEYEPDVVILAYVMNDVTPADGIGALCRASHPDSWGRRLHSHLWIWVANRMERRVFWRNRSFDRPARLFERLAELREKGTTVPLVVLFPQLNEDRTGWNRPEEYERAKKLAEDRGLPVVDLKARWKDAADRLTTLYHDRTHLSAAGHAEVGRILAQVLPPLLERGE